MPGCSSRAIGARRRRAPGPARGLGLDRLPPGRGKRRRAGLPVATPRLHGGGLRPASRGGARGITRMVFPGARSGDARYKVLDTSVIIDGRIADVCQAGFLEGTLLVPQYVLRELQQIADSSDPLKRNRGRRGLDVLQRLQRLPGRPDRAARPRLPRTSARSTRELIETARAVGGVIVTNDYNLNKVAELHGVRVLNVNELAGALRPVVLPGRDAARARPSRRKGGGPGRRPTSTTGRWSLSSRAADTSARRSPSW